MYLKKMSESTDASLQEALYQRMSLAISRVAELVDENTVNSRGFKALQTHTNKIETSCIAGISKWEAAWIEGLTKLQRNAQ